MARKTTFVVLAVAAILFLQFTDCMSAFTQDQESMQCCRSMPCDPSNQTHECCKTMVSPQSPSVLPAAHVTVHPPTIVAAGLLPTPQLLAVSKTSSDDFTALQHSPPKLYTLHSSFLI